MLLELSSFSQIPRAHRVVKATSPEFGSIGTDVNAAGAVCMTLELPDQGLVMQIPDSNVAITAAAEAHF